MGRLNFKDQQDASSTHGEHFKSKTGGASAAPANDCSRVSWSRTGAKTWHDITRLRWSSLSTEWPIATLVCPRWWNSHLHAQSPCLFSSSSARLHGTIGDISTPEASKPAVRYASMGVHCDYVEKDCAGKADCVIL